MPRVLICGQAQPEALVESFRSHGLEVDRSAEVPKAAEAETELVAVCPRPGEVRHPELRAALSALCAPAHTVVGVLLPGEDGDLTYELLRLGVLDASCDPRDLGERLLGRMAAVATRTLGLARERERLLALAHTDGLTGLPNFRAFMARLEHEFRRARRYHLPLSCVLVDLDDLKGVNDRYGHPFGNQALVATGRALAGDLREMDFAARYGGDEFAVLLPHTDERQAAFWAERAARRLSGSPLASAPAGSPSLQASFGVAASVGEEPEAEELLRRADAALYLAKRRGKRQVALASTLTSEQAGLGPP